MKKWPYILTILFLCSLSCLLIAGLSFGDHISNLRDYTLTFVVPFPPSNVQMTTIAPERQDGFYEQSFCEGYYSFYFNDLSDVTELTFKVYQNRYNKTPFEFTIEKPTHLGETIFTLDLTQQQVYEGLYPYRSFILIAPRVGFFLSA